MKVLVKFDYFLLSVIAWLFQYTEEFERYLVNFPDAGNLANKASRTAEKPK